MAAVEVVDPQRVRFRLKQPWPDFMTFYATPATGAAWVVPKKYTERVGEDGFKKAPVGAGPYRFVSFNPGVELIVEAYDGYWRKTPAVKRLVFKSVPDESTRLAMLKRGETDVAYSIRGPNAEEVKRTPGLTLKATFPTFTEWLVFTEQWDPKSPWSDRRVRLAANLAIDKQGDQRGGVPRIQQAGAEHHSARLRVLLGAARLSVRSGAGEAAPGGGGLSEGLRRGRARDRRRVRARGRGRHQRASGDRHPRAAPDARARGLLQGGPGEAVQASRPRGQRGGRQRRDADRGVRDLRRESRSYGGYPDIDALFRDQAEEMDKKRRETMLHKIQQLMHERAMFAPILEPAFLIGVGPRMGEVPTIAGHPYFSPYEDLKLKGR